MKGRQNLIDGLMERIEYAISVCEKNGYLSYDQQQDFNDACYRLRQFGEDAENYVVDSICHIHKIFRKSWSIRHRTLNTSLKSMGY